MPHLTRYSGKCRLFYVMRLPCSVARWKEHLYTTIPRQLNAGTKIRPSGWLSSRPGYEPDTYRTLNKRPNHSTLKPTLVLCSSYLLSCSEIRNTKVWRLNVSCLLLAALYVQTASAPSRLVPLDAPTSPPLHPKTERDQVWESLHLLPQTFEYCCLNTGRWIKC